MTLRAVIRPAKDTAPAYISDPGRGRRTRTHQAERGRGRPAWRSAQEGSRTPPPPAVVRDLAEETFDEPTETMWASALLDTDFDMDADDLLAGATSIYRAVNAEEGGWE
ncbi:hypothetical protein GCM10007887_01540 [Methylobacterium haplocladii]|uniref:Uncharacterized protein n=1 Tax=Methylobacterium haplocladii TaxID=1176176 RepID=A0A512IJJ4_9HYPH|nr:hypothetical protein MHA02_02570 [Methylobacterium haplocladii]GJD82713.1 hypothetical protein HPGCJGGD_0572 [Methylobacterium haplocladii]GLS57499.1 hypothetical protein GCM10007887_01540 [Methylobacterium haplocladii]